MEEVKDEVVVEEHEEVEAKVEDEVKLEDMDRPTLVQYAKSLGVKPVGKTPILVEAVKQHFRDEAIKEAGVVEKVVEEPEPEPEPEVKEVIPEVKEKVVVGETKFNGKVVMTVEDKLVNGRSFKEVRVVTGETFLLSQEEFDNQVK